MKTNSLSGFVKSNLKAFSKPLKRFGSSLSLYDASFEDEKPAKDFRDDSMLFNKSEYRNSDQSGRCFSPTDRRSSPTGSICSSHSQMTPSRQLTDGERLKKVIVELIDTERTYVKHLNNLLQNYLEPLRNAPFLSSAEVSALFGNIQEIVAFQRLFLQSLQEAVDMEPQFHNLEHPYEFKNVLFSIGSAFLYYASQFKLYSSFCASHSKAQKVLHPSEGNQALQEFLASRNPRQQHSATLESYLIKPIQRILKYPLLLQQLKSLTEPNSEENLHLLDALKVMEKVAEHINEMQRIHEEYGAIFDHLFRQYQKSSKQSIDLSPGDLLYYGGVEWLNISDFLGKIKKGLELHAMCFVFKSAVVFLCKERLRQKKKLMGGTGKNSSSEVEIIRYQVLIPVTEVQVRASSMKDMDNHFLWELIHLKSQPQRRSEKVYHLSNSTCEFRNAFLKTIRQIIRESVRNMNIPLNRGPMLSGSNSIGGEQHKMPSYQSRTTAKKRAAPNQSASLQRYGTKTEYDNVESYDNVPETQPRTTYYQSKSLQSQGNTSGSSYDSDQSAQMRTRSKHADAMDELSDSTTKSDAGQDRSETEEDAANVHNGLGQTPNHLSLSTTSTLSTGSTGSQARLIHASNQPANYQPARSNVGSPVWKPRDDFGSMQSVKSGLGSTSSLSKTYSSHSAYQQQPSETTNQSHELNKSGNLSQENIRDSILFNVFRQESQPCKLHDAFRANILRQNSQPSVPVAYESSNGPNNPPYRTIYRQNSNKEVPSISTAQRQNSSEQVNPYQDRRAEKSHSSESFKNYNHRPNQQIQKQFSSEVPNSNSIRQLYKPNWTDISKLTISNNKDNQIIQRPSSTDILNAFNKSNHIERPNSTDIFKAFDKSSQINRPNSANIFNTLSSNINNNRPSSTDIFNVSKNHNKYIPHQNSDDKISQYSPISTSNCRELQRRGSREISPSYNQRNRPTFQKQNSSESSFSYNQLHRPLQRQTSSTFVENTSIKLNASRISPTRQVIDPPQKSLFKNNSRWSDLMADPEEKFAKRYSPLRAEKVSYKTATIHRTVSYTSLLSVVESCREDEKNFIYERKYESAKQEQFNYYR